MKTTLSFKELVYYPNIDTITWPKSIPMARVIKENDVPDLSPEYEKKFIGKGLWIEEKREHKMSFYDLFLRIFFQSDYDFLEYIYPNLKIVIPCEEIDRRILSFNNQK